MAISVYYEFSAPESLTESDVVRALEASRKRAIGLQFGVVSALNRQVATPQFAFCIEDPFQTGAVLKIIPLRGFWYRIQLAHSTDSALIGLCRFPAVVRVGGHDVSSGLGEGWHFQSSCRTQSPAQREFAGFRRRHASLIDLLHAVQTLGIKTEVEDDGGYWATNEVSSLEAQFKIQLESAPLLDVAFADALEGRAPQRDHLLFGTPLKGQFSVHLSKRGQ